MTIRGFAAGAAVVLLCAATAQAGVTPEQKCEGGKNQAAGRYAACIAKAEKGLVTKGDTTKYGEALVKCEDKLTKSWDKLGTVCPGDQTPVADFMDACGQSVAAALAGGLLGLDPVECGLQLATCESGFAGVGEDLAIANGQLATCSGDLSSTNSDLGTCNGSLSTCGSDLTSTNADLGTCSGDLSSTNADLGTCNGSLTTCSNDLAVCNTDTLLLTDGWLDCIGNLATTNADLGTCNGNLATCSSDLSGTNADLGTCNGNLSSTNSDLGNCTTDLSSTNTDLGNCNGSLGTCTTDLSSTNADLAALNAQMRCPTSGVEGAYVATIAQPSGPPAYCRSDLEVSGGIVTATITLCSNGTPDMVTTGTVTGNLMELVEEPSAACGGDRSETTVTYDNNCDTGTGTFVCITAEGGTIFATSSITTARLDGRYFDSSFGGDATVIDFQTGLEWVVTDDAGGLTDKDNLYTWSTGDNSFNGTAKTVYIDGLNDVAGGGTNCYAGHCDWRLPSVAADGDAAELETILDLTAPGCGSTSPCIDESVFGPTRPDIYWSSSTYQGSPNFARVVNFVAGSTGANFKTSTYFARAVRAGS